MDGIEGIPSMYVSLNEDDGKKYKRISAMIRLYIELYLRCSFHSFLVWQKERKLIFMDLILSVEYFLGGILCEFNLTDLFSWFLSDNVNCENPRLLISPSQMPLRLPVGNSKMITCQGKVENNDLISDLRWTNAEGIQIQPKT